ncbi:MAG: SPASM domain-containing protein [Bacteroidales bacterium]|jgi:uncharacterized protein|nr:SPASM domain-containing protein [Bacteroidales bacterium]
MILSRYNFLFKSEKYGFLLYNSLSNCFLEISEDIYLLLKEINLSEKIVEQIIPSDLIDVFKKNKIIVNNDLDEYYKIKFNTLYQRFYDKSLELTINPTLACNFSCGYCFECNKEAKIMTDETEKNIIKFINSYDTVENIHVTWFGGEPLIAYNKIESLTKKILEINKNYSAHIITNGYLLNEKITKSMEGLKISFIQITIDGTEEVHNSRRHLINGGKTFEKIIQNIELIFQINPKIQVGIRVNIDGSNENEFICLYNYLYDKWNKFENKNIFIAPGFVTSTNICNSVSDCLFDKKNKIDFLINLFIKHGLQPISFYPRNNRYECPIRNPFHLTIGPEGELYKCWNDVGNKEKIIGNLNNKGLINETLLTRYYTAADPLEDTNCIKCFHFPTCGGGCPYQRIERLYNNVNIETCDLIKDNLTEFLEWHYSSQNISK